MSCSLVRPRPGAFISSVKCLLVVATFSDVSLFALCRRPSTNINSDAKTIKWEVRSLPEYIAATNGLVIHCIEGSNTGRIFMGGKDGMIYELIYIGSPHWGQSSYILPIISVVAQFFSSFYVATLDCNYHYLDPIVQLLI